MPPAIHSPKDVPVLGDCFLRRSLRGLREDLGTPATLREIHGEFTTSQTPMHTKNTSDPEIRVIRGIRG